MKYDAVLLDADDTIFDFETAEANSIKGIIASMGITDPEAYAVYRECNSACWAALEKGRITQAELRSKRFSDLALRYGIECDAIALGDAFVEALSKQGMLLPHAEHVVRELAGRMPVALVTNGIAAVQRGRIRRSAISDQFSAIIISEELGVSKPDPRMICAALTALNVNKDRALMVGDSISSDMRAANAAGVDFCWFNPRRKKAPPELRVAYEIDDIRKLIEIVM